MVTTLNPRQLLFAQNVIQGMTLTAAYREAGYSGEGHVAHTGASKLMAKPAIAAFIEAHQQQATLSAIADRREILGRLTKVLRSESADLDDLPVHEVSRRTIFKSDGTQITRVRSKSMSRHAAIQQLARMLGLKKPHRDDQYRIAHQKDVAKARATVASVLGEADANPIPPDPPVPGASDECFILQIGRNLNSRQRLFCEYLARDIPATNAYRLAGYGFYQNPDHAAAASSRLLKRPAVIAYLRDLRRHTAPAHDGSGDFADRGETLAYLTQALRASRADIETQGRFTDQIVHDEIEKSDGQTETRVLIKSISQPRAMTQLATLLDATGASGPAEDEDEETRLTLLEMAAMFADPGPTLPADEERLDPESPWNDPEY